MILQGRVQDSCVIMLDINAVPSALIVEKITTSLMIVELMRFVFLTFLYVRLLSI